MITEEGKKGFLMSMDEATRDNILKTAEYVKQYGGAFEEKLLNSSDEKFAFLRPEHEYHAFYKSLFRVGDDGAGSVDNNKHDDEQNTNESERSKNKKNKKKNKTTGEKGREKNGGPYIPARPKQLIFSSYDSNDVSNQALQIIQRTAEFCARSTFRTDNNNNGSNSDGIIDLLRAKSKGDDTFDFLNPEHRLNSLFTNFLNQYKRILPHVNNGNQRPPPPQTKFLETCFRRAQYNEYTKYLSSRNTEIKRLYAIRFAAINWANIHGDNEKDSKGNSGGRRVIPMNLWDKHSKDSKKPTSTALYMKPLDFKQLSKKNISTSLIKRSIEKYFSEGSLKMEHDEGVTPRDNKKEKKRKGKFIVKEAGESRLKRKKQKR